MSMPTEPNDASQHRDATDVDTAAEQARDTSEPESTRPARKLDPADRPKEYGGPKGPEPVRYGDWEKNGRCIDF